MFKKIKVKIEEILIILYLFLLSRQNDIFKTSFIKYLRCAKKYQETSTDSHNLLYYLLL